MTFAVDWALKNNYLIIYPFPFVIIQLSFSPPFRVYIISVCPFVALLKATYAENAHIFVVV